MPKAEKFALAAGAEQPQRRRWRAASARAAKSTWAERSLIARIGQHVGEAVTAHRLQGFAKADGSL